MAHIYFDNNATTAISQNVISEMMRICDKPSNPSSIHALGRNAKQLIENARAKIGVSLNVPKGFRILFTSSATEANNLVLHSAKASDRKIFTIETEHPSVLKGPIDEFLKVKESGEINLNDINSSGFYSIMIANNETGVIQPMNDIVQQVKCVNGILHVDAVQAIGKIPFSCEEIGANAYTISGHKFGGPYGVGCLIYDSDAIKIKPLMFGGGQEYGLRPGTENVMAIHGLAVATEDIAQRVQIMQTKTKLIRDYIENEIVVACDNVRIFGKNAKHRLPNTISMTMPGVKSELQVAYFDSHGIAVSAGAACSAGRVDHPHVQMAMNSSYEDASCTLRVSLGIDNTMEEAQLFIQKWKELYERHRNG